MSEEQGIYSTSTAGNPSILNLSDEILLMIINFLRTEEKFALSKVCSRFDRILLDKRLCRNIEISPKQDGSCLQYIGFYLRRRRHLIFTVNINNCDWIPMSRIKFLTKGLSNLHSLHVLNISLPVLTLSKILKESKQLRELAWSWRGDGKPDKTWSNIPPEDRSALSNLVRLHICLPDPWTYAVQEFLLVFCCSLTHLKVQVDPALGRLPITKEVKEERLLGHVKLKSLVAYQVSYGSCVDANITLTNDIKLATLIKHLWNSSGGLNCTWEHLWTNIYSKMQWSDEIECTSEFTIISSNLKSITLRSNEFACIRRELPVTDLVIAFPLSEQRYNLPPLQLIAPKVEKLAVVAKTHSIVLNAWVTSAIHGSDHLVELNLLGVHYCGAVSSLEDFWLAIKSLSTLRKLAVAPCVIPRNEKSTSIHWNKETFIVSSSSNTTEISKNLSEALGLKFLEEFEVAQSYSGLINPQRQMLCENSNWIPYIPVISFWTKLTCLTIDSIISLRTMAHFKLVAKACINLSSLRFRAIGPKGHCGYVKDIASALSYCSALKYFRLEQQYISDFLKDLLIGLSECSQLEGVCITNCNSIENSHLKSKQDFQETILKLLNNCPFLCFIQVPLPDATRNTCNRLKNWLMTKLIRSSGVPVVMEFCARLTIFEDIFHAFPPDAPRIDQMQWQSKVALTPPVT